LHSFKKEFDWRLEVAYIAASKLVKIQDEQNKILEELKKLNKETETIGNGL
jgi:hypothetical protein